MFPRLFNFAHDDVNPAAWINAEEEMHMIRHHAHLGNAVTVVCLRCQY